MRFLFVTTHAYLPIFYGGSEMSTDNLARMFMDKGHHVAVLSGLRNKNQNVTELYYRIRARLSHNSMTVGRKLGYPVYRCWEPENKVNICLDLEKSDIVIIQAGKQNLLADAVVKMNKPVIYYLRDLGFDFKDNPAILDKATFIANSSYTARAFEFKTGRTAHVIPPLVLPDLYRNPCPGENVLLVNPNHQKGVDVALQLAENCPDIPFIFVEGWGLPKNLEKPVKERAAKLHNLKWLPSTNNMKSVYALAKIVLCPSGTPFQGQPIEWTEAWGRVVSEAHFSGIPVIATKAGGLPESVGPGGILVDKNADIKEWKHALRSLWDNDKQYNDFSEKARKYSDREEFTPQFLVEKLLQICYKLTQNS